MGPYKETKTFQITIELEAEFGDEYEGDDDGGAWLREWMETVRPQMLSSVIRALGADKRFKVRPFSRGRSPDDVAEFRVTFEPPTKLDTDLGLPLFAKKVLKNNSFCRFGVLAAIFSGYN
jgi:hypothetical protein